MALLATVFTSRYADQLTAGVARDTAYTDGLSRAFLVGAVMAVLGLVAALVLIRQSRAGVVEEPVGSSV